VPETAQANHVTDYFFGEVLPFAQDMSLDDDLWLCDPLELEEDLLKRMPLRGLKHNERKALLREYKAI
jgi:hypothetical protein